MQQTFGNYLPTWGTSMAVKNSKKHAVGGLQSWKMSFSTGVIGKSNTNIEIRPDHNHKFAQNKFSSHLESKQNLTRVWILIVFLTLKANISSVLSLGTSGFKWNWTQCLYTIFWHSISSPFMRSTVASYSNESFSFKWEWPILHPSSLCCTSF